MAAADAKVRLELIVDRRNKIAHEADMDPTNPNLSLADDRFYGYSGLGLFRTGC